MSGPVAGPLFGFVQVEYPWVLGPADGRYVLRGHAGVPAHVLMLATLGAAERRSMLGRRRKLREADADAGPTPVVTARATLVSAEPFATHEAAERWRKEVDVDAEADQAIAELNRVLHAHRVAAVDPFVRELSREAALVVRVGVGEGEPLAHGHFTTAVELPPRVQSKADARSATTLRPQERLAAILGGRDVALACEALALRARLDADAGRTREAALQLRVALEAAIAELAPWGDREALALRIDELRDERGTVGTAANAAINGGLDEETAEDVRRVLEVLESALRARTAIGLE